MNLLTTDFVLNLSNDLHGLTYKYYVIYFDVFDIIIKVASSVIVNLYKIENNHELVDV